MRLTLYLKYFTYRYLSIRYEGLMNQHRMSQASYLTCLFSHTFCFSYSAILWGIWNTTFYINVKRQHDASESTVFARDAAPKEPLLHSGCSVRSDQAGQSVKCNY